MATTMSSTPYKTPSHGHSSSRSSRPSTTPRAPYPTVASTGQSRPPRLSPATKSPRDLQGSSPNYFGLVVGDDSVGPESGPGPHVKQNWNSPTSSARPGSRPDRIPDYEMFRRQSERSIAFALSGLPTSRNSSISSPTQQNPPSSSSHHARKPSVQFKAGDEYASGQKPRKDSGIEDVSFFNNVAHTDSPASMSPRHSVTAHNQARLSLPASELAAQLSELTPQRSETIPTSISKENPAMAAPQEIAQALEQHPDKVLVLDLRVYPQYASSRIKGALNLCIPTTLLKRPAFNVQKLAETFTSTQNREKFNTWKDVNYIIAYDATSSQPKEAVIPFNVLKKFAGEGWKGQGLVVKGGFHGFKKLVPRLVDNNQPSAGKSSNASTISIPNKAKLPVAGGCEMPATENAANPFFGNIRQNMDLIDGVGQLPIKKPANMSDVERRTLPTWLRRAAADSNEGKSVSDKFLGIEKTEQQVMRDALSANVCYGTPSIEKAAGIQVAGIEKGNKNRYNNIFPYEHSRVRLQNVPSYGCDYVNASYVKAEYSNRKYIATQAPIPATFEDFYKVIWQQEVGVIVMLTAESEGGQVKGHAYWKSNEYGPLRVKLVAEKKIVIGNKARFSQSQSRPHVSRRLTTSNSTPAVEKTFDEATNPRQPSEDMMVIVRYLSISNTAHPSQPAREVTQLQYVQWPDLGTPASPGAILGLIDLVNKYQRATTNPSQTQRSTEPVPEGQRPLIVHCSAGCGRTGTFCTIDSVIDMLKRQRLAMLAREDDGMDIDSKDDWLGRDDIDLVAKTVQDFRSQRLSMVQNLRQFVLCYESILQWLHDEASFT